MTSQSAAVGEVSVSAAGWGSMTSGACALCCCSSPDKSELEEVGSCTNLLSQASDKRHKPLERVSLACAASSTYSSSTAGGVADPCSSIPLLRYQLARECQQIMLTACWREMPGRASKQGGQDCHYGLPGPSRARRSKPTPGKGQIVLQRPQAAELEPRARHLAHHLELLLTTAGRVQPARYVPAR